LKPTIVVISDSIGETARGVVMAALSQFNSAQVELKKFSYVKTREDIEEIIDRFKPGESILVYTLVNPELRQDLAQLADEVGLLHIDILGPVLENFEQLLDKKPRLEPGLIHQLDEEYFQRVEAIEFTVKYDDRNDPRGIELADVVLVGVSRTSKTPMSVYLSYQGYKAANIPLVPEVPPPDLLYKNPDNKIIGLTIDPLLLNEIRQERLKSLGLDRQAQYASIKRINQELEYSSQIMRRIGCPIINVTNKSVEESANEILKYLRDK